MDMQTAGDVIKQLGGKPYPDEVVAEALGLSPSAVRSWIALNRFPRRLQHDLEALAAASNIEIDPSLFPPAQKPGRKRKVESNGTT